MAGKPFGRGIPISSLRSILVAPVVLAAISLPADATVSIDWVTVGGPGNACDQQRQGCHGAVGETYRIARTEVTNVQYAAFLNAVAATDANALYNPDSGGDGGGIARSGSPGSFAYAAIEGRESKPVNLVSFWDALRFANWLHNGQPRGAQDATTTEDGAYTLTPTGLASGKVMRNADVARFFLPSEDEWYKAAYYDPESKRYFDYPAGSDRTPGCAPPGDAPNTGNCWNKVGDLTDVGSYTGSASPSGTFDQGGNVFEWNEAFIRRSARNVRGGGFHRSPIDFKASNRLHYHAPATEKKGVGFRVASRVPASSEAGLEDAP